ncbi:type II toxin-antitoxin system RelE/ParE family toxin [Limnohabitans sp.]|uniref:type II toxin-antitoxin system RelE/ParE family toxin n=1 Tax=Limnohabitans sp. TaxID=1907725 RepID=UPI00333F7AFE
MKVLTTPRFNRTVKKLHLQEKHLLDEAVRFIISKPEAGELKKGDLTGVRVHKYKFNTKQMLLAYAANTQEQVIILLGYGAHENFYRDLKH